MKENKEKVSGWKKYRRYKDGAKYYDLSENTFRKIAIEAGAVSKINKIALVNCEIFEKYIDTFRLESPYYY